MRRITPLVLALGALVFGASCGADEPRRPNVLLITIDTLRADRLSCYGFPRETSPRLDELARESVVFEAAQTPRSKTTPAVASMLTGRYPHAHGVRDLAAPLSKDLPLLQERLRERGYSTGGIVGNWVLGDPRAGLARGFDLWCESFPDHTGVPPDHAPQRRATSMTDAALVALGLESAPQDEQFEPRRSIVATDRPWFLWLHYMDPHGAYEPPEEHRRFERENAELVDVRAPSAPDARTKRRFALYNVPEEAWVDADHVDAARVRDFYDGEIRYVDHEVGRLFDALRADGRFDDTIVIVTSDHGESLGEHDYWFEHGAYTYESTARIPLIVRVPGVAPARCAQPFSLVDLQPTLLELLGLPLPNVGSAPFGVSKLAALRGAPLATGATSAIFSEKVEAASADGAVQIKAVRTERWKLIQRYVSRRADDAAATRSTFVIDEELYDLQADPLESWNLAAAIPGDAPVALLRRELAQFVAADRDLAALGDLLAAHRRGLEIQDPDAARTLRLLGY